MTDNHFSESLRIKGMAVRRNPGDFSLDLKFTERGVKTGVQGEVGECQGEVNGGFGLDLS